MKLLDHIILFVLTFPYFKECTVEFLYFVFKFIYFVLKFVDERGIFFNISVHLIVAGNFYRVKLLRACLFFFRLLTNTAVVLRIRVYPVQFILFSYILFALTVIWARKPIVCISSTANIHVNLFY